MQIAGIPTPSAVPRPILSLRLRPLPLLGVGALVVEVVGVLADVDEALGCSLDIVGPELMVLEKVEVVEGGVDVDVAFTMLTSRPFVWVHWN
jgi:hypothetical protein